MRRVRRGDLSNRWGTNPAGCALRTSATWAGLPTVSARFADGSGHVGSARPIHIHDLVAVQETEFPDVKPLQPEQPARTCLATPLLREGAPIGAIIIRRTEVRPFTEKQVKLLETFATRR